MLSSKSQARLYDMPMSRAAAEMEPVSRIDSNSRALPGPMRAPESKTIVILSLAIPLAASIGVGPASIVSSRRQPREDAMSDQQPDSDDLGLAAKVASVTGGGAPDDGTGNGRAAAILLARAGAKVLVVDIIREAAEQTVAMIEKDRGVAAPFVVD